MRWLYRRGREPAPTHYLDQLEDIRKNIEKQVVMINGMTGANKYRPTADKKVLLQVLVDNMETNLELLKGLSIWDNAD